MLSRSLIFKNATRHFVFFQTLNANWTNTWSRCPTSSQAHCRSQTEEKFTGTQAHWKTSGMSFQLELSGMEILICTCIYTDQGYLVCWHPHFAFFSVSLWIFLIQSTSAKTLITWKVKSWWERDTLKFWDTVLFRWDSFTLVDVKCRSLTASSLNTSNITIHLLCSNWWCFGFADPSLWMELYGAFNTGCLEGISKKEDIQIAFLPKALIYKIMIEMLLSAPKSEFLWLNTQHRKSPHI